MDVTYKYRTDYGLPATVYSLNKATKRKVLPRELGLVMVHYTGVDKAYANQDTAKVILSIDRWKSGEYNYVIDQRGVVWEFAGPFEGAHCLNYNNKSYGVLMLNGTEEPLTDAQVASFGWLMSLLRFTGQINATPYIVPHKMFRATTCPGPKIMARMSELQAFDRV